eukprot:TRINITY_DN8353_c0_g1_i5.p1 TRINITY_DN8353_c0_g1~~TRINITY_DN8353_c0_g1_i5.p1  ORF type:complete len:113 (+),score=9.43 TRINITY_DN8353_c0_g1_i5:90-428(+)
MSDLMEVIWWKFLILYYLKIINLTEALVCIEAAAVTIDRIKHVQLQSPSNVRRQPQKKARYPGEIGAEGDQRRRPDSGDEPPPEDWEESSRRPLPPIAEEQHCTDTGAAAAL